jgi:hypothetical protein
MQNIVDLEMKVKKYKAQMDTRRTLKRKMAKAKRMKMCIDRIAHIGKVNIYAEDAHAAIQRIVKTLFRHT